MGRETTIPEGSQRGPLLRYELEAHPLPRGSTSGSNPPAERLPQDEEECGALVIAQHRRGCTPKKDEYCLPRGNFSIVILRWCFQNVCGNTMTRVISKAEDLWVDEGVLDK